MNTETIKKIVDQVNLKDPKTVSVAAKKLVESAIDLSPGTKVTLVDEEGASGCPNVGAVGTIKGESAKGAGWYDVEFADGSVHPCQADLLVPLK
jgi:hypothetical protein